MELKPITFIKGQRISNKEEALQEAKKILMNRLFLGNYDERRYVDRLKEYRDVVTISPAEKEFVADLEEVRHLLIKYCEAEWIGIAGSDFKEVPSCICLWVRLSNIPFGHFWFKIKQIKFEHGEIILKLKCIRSVHLQDFEDLVRSNNKKIQDANKERNEQSLVDFDFGKKLSVIHLHLNNAVQQIQPYLTWRNFILIGKFIITIIFVMVTTIISCICYLGDYVLRLIKELTLFLEAFSPVLIQVIDCFTKIIGGFFILIALIFKNSTKGEQLLQNERMLLMKSVLQPSTQVIVPINWKERNRTLKTQMLS